MTHVEHIALDDNTSYIGNKMAPEGSVYVCTACGKMSRDRYGLQHITFGWDVSCMMNCVLAEEKHLIIREGRVVALRNDES